MNFWKSIKSNSHEAVGSSSIWALCHTKNKCSVYPKHAHELQRWQILPVLVTSGNQSKSRFYHIHELCLLYKQDASCLLVSTSENQAQVVILKSIFFLCSEWLGITKATTQTSALGLLCGSQECVSIQPSDKASTWHWEPQRTKLDLLVLSACSISPGMII